MNRLLSSRLENLTPYVPGEQPQDQQYLKLNTNESPFPPSAEALRWAQENVRPLNLYSEPVSRELRAAMAQALRVSPDQVMMTNGSDEALNLAMVALCDDARPAAFPDITYGFYAVIARANGVPYEEVPLKDDFTVDVSALSAPGRTVFLANPNAPTGIPLPLSEVRKLLNADPDRAVVVDEAYVDFGGESAVSLLKEYDNLLVIGTFSKSRSLAGGRLGYAVGNPALIKALDTLRDSTNPYNINSYTQALGLAILKDEARVRENCRRIVQNREETAERLRALGFAVLPSRTNFVFAANPTIDGGELYRRLKARGVLVRHFDKERIARYNRITIGTKEQMDRFFTILTELWEE